MTTTTPTPTQAVAAAYRRLSQTSDLNIWISVRDEQDAQADARAVEASIARGEERPLAGRVFAVKDNIDIVGMPTTAAHPAFARHPERTATAVQRLLDAGAVVIGKTNMDQFATGLVGTRSPYGIVRSALEPYRVSGGSSSGSGAAVGFGLVDFALGTDTGGSGRIPAAFNGVVGVKPTLGLVPVDGVLPACPSYDTVTVFAHDLALAARVLRTMSGPSAHDPRSRPWPATAPLAAPEHPVVAVPRAQDLSGLSTAAREAFSDACQRTQGAGATLREVDLSVFLRAAALLYDGGLVAERAYSFGPFLAKHPEGADPSVAKIAQRAAQVQGVDVVADQQELVRLTAAGLAVLEGVSALLLPTAPEHPLVQDERAEPLAVNARLGTYTNFVNLMDMAAVAVPATRIPGEGMFGVSFITRAFEDQVGVDLAARFLTVPSAQVFHNALPLAVFGAHMRGQALNGQLQELGARFDEPIRTSDTYRMHALPGQPAKPIVSPAGPGGGGQLAGELWLMSTNALGELLAVLPRPMALGRVQLSDGREVLGFTGHPAGEEKDITSFGGWRSYLDSPAHLQVTPDEPDLQPA